MLSFFVRHGNYDDCLRAKFTTQRRKYERSKNRDSTTGDSARVEVSNSKTIESSKAIDAIVNFDISKRSKYSSGACASEFSLSSVVC